MNNQSNMDRQPQIKGFNTNQEAISCIIMTKNIKTANNNINVSKNATRKNKKKKNSR